MIARNFFGLFFFNVVSKRMILIKKNSTALFNFAGRCRNS